MCNQQCGYWCPGAKAPGHQYPQCCRSSALDHFHTKMLHSQRTKLKTKTEFTFALEKKYPVVQRLNMVWIRCLLIPKDLFCIETNYCNMSDVGPPWLTLSPYPPLGTTVLEHHANTLRPRQDDRQFLDDIFKCIFLNENVYISIKISLKFVPKGPIDNIPALVQILAWRLRWLIYWRLYETRPQ